MYISGMPKARTLRDSRASTSGRRRRALDSCRFLDFRWESKSFFANAERWADKELRMVKVRSRKKSAEEIEIEREVWCVFGEQYTDFAGVDKFESVEFEGGGAKSPIPSIGSNSMDRHSR